MTVNAGKVLRWLSVALTAGVTIAGIVTVGYAAITFSDGQHQSPRQTAVVTQPSLQAAESLLADAYSLARAHNYAGLCQDIAQDSEMCQLVIQQAGIAGAAPSGTQPSVLSAMIASNTPTSQGAEVLVIRGIRADGTVYNNHFSVVRTAAGQLRSQTAVYWYSNFVSSSQ